MAQALPAQGCARRKYPWGMLLGRRKKATVRRRGVEKNSTLVIRTVKAVNKKKSIAAIQGNLVY
jgi:hypothetical protein